MKPELMLYVDGRCPFCVHEMRRLKRWDLAGRLGFTDIAAPDFDPAVLGTGLAALNRELHSTTADGKVLIGIDSIVAAYTLVDRGWRVLPLRLLVLRPLLAGAYRWFARRRYQISARMGLGPVKCASGSCT